jgi:hypothetical protein
MSGGHGVPPVPLEERIGPAVMVRPTSPPLQADTFAQDAAQAHAPPTSQGRAGGLVAVLEILKPAAHRAVDVEDDGLETVPGRALGLGPARRFELRRALRAGPAIAALEGGAEKVKTALVLGVHESGFLRMQFQARLRDPLLHLHQGPVGFVLTPTQDHEVIGVAHHLVARLRHDMGQGVEIEVCQQRAQHAPNNVAKRPLEFFIRLSREHLRPTYGQGFRGAPLQTDTEEPRPQTIRPGGSRAQVIQTTSEVSRSEEEI